jgi:isoamylase
MQDPVLSRVKLIAEPWDIGPGGYRVGEFPPGWMEWNDTFRDRSRGFWIGRDSSAELAKALTGSPEIFDHHGRRPWTSVNFITAHDGFTMNDLVTYNDKHNLENGEDNRDGSNDNRSWNCGVEGPSNDGKISSLRGRQMRNLMATLLLSQGTPMMLAGDEFARTQRGNNNAYCQDNDISWVDWSQRESNAEMLAFTKKLLALRFRYPVLRSSRYLHDEVDTESGIHELCWFLPDGTETQRTEWNGDAPRCFGMMIDGEARPSGLSERGHTESLLLVVNDFHEDTPFALPTHGKWRLLLDTDRDVIEETPEPAATYTVKAQSLALFVKDVPAT